MPLCCAIRIAIASEKFALFTVEYFCGKTMYMFMDVKWIIRRLDETGMTQRELARKTGIDPDKISKTLSGKRNIQMRELPVLQRVLGDPNHSPKNNLDSDADLVQFHAPIPKSSDTIPVYGYVSGSGAMLARIDDAHIVEHRPRPPELFGVNGAFYVRVIGDSMEPRFEQGELASVNPGALPAKNQDCVIITHDGDAHIKRLIGITDGVVRCLQYNPRKEVEYTNVRAIYAVVGRSKG